MHLWDSRGKEIFDKRVFSIKLVMVDSPFPFFSHQPCRTDKSFSGGGEPSHNGFLLLVKKD